MFGMGYWELLLVLVLGTLCIALPVFVFGFVGWMLVRANRKLDQTQEMIQRQEENARLRQQVHDKEQ